MRAADAAKEAGTRALDSVATHDGSGIDFLVGIYNDIAPFVSRLIFDGDLPPALPPRLPSPWWWLTSTAVVVVAVVLLLVVIDEAMKRPLAAG